MSLLFCLFFDRIKQIGRTAVTEGMFMKHHLKRSAIFCIIVEISYFISVTLFLVLKTDWALTLWEAMTVFGAFAMSVTMSVFAEGYQIKAVFRRAMLISLSGTMFLTSAAHITSIGVTRKLAAQGVSVPDHFRIGFYPSYEMTIDYTAWGLFMGCAFLALFLGVGDKMIKRFSLCCGILCFAGFVGSFFYESLWYPAPMGYGFGFLIMCIAVLIKNKGTGEKQ
jgi:hypothetical protein